MGFKDKGIVFWAYVLVLKVHIVLELVLLFILVLVELLALESVLLFILVLVL